MESEMMFATPLGRGLQSASFETPGQAGVVDAVHRMIGNVCQHMAQLAFAVDTIQLGDPDQPVDGGSACASAVGAGKEFVAPA